MTVEEDDTTDDEVVEVTMLEDAEDETVLVEREESLDETDDDEDADEEAVEDEAEDEVVGAL